MPTSDQYRKIADKYYRFAREARTETDRLALLDLAELCNNVRRLKTR